MDDHFKTLTLHGKKMHVKEIYVIFIHLFDSRILLFIDLNKKKGEKVGGAMMKIEIKTQDQTLSKNNNPGLVFH